MYAGSEIPVRREIKKNYLTLNIQRLHAIISRLLAFSVKLAHFKHCPNCALYGVHQLLMMRGSVNFRLSHWPDHSTSACVFSYLLCSVYWPTDFRWHSCPDNELARIAPGFTLLLDKVSVNSQHREACVTPILLKGCSHGSLHMVRGVLTGTDKNT